MIKQYLSKFYFTIFLLAVFSLPAQAQTFEREFPIKAGGLIEIINLSGRVEILAQSEFEDKGFITANAFESDFKIEAAGGKMRLETVAADPQNRIDITIKIPERTRLKVKTREGEVKVSGNFEQADVFTETGTIAADVPLENVKYDFVWTRSRPRFLSDAELEEVKEKAAGKFVINGKIINEVIEDVKPEPETEPTTEERSGKEKKEKKKKNDNRIQLNLTTERGIILLNVNPNEVPSNLRERPLTEAAKAIIRSGDALLTEAIRRASPKYFGDYAKTLPPLRREPQFSKGKPDAAIPVANVKRVLVQVTDLNNRAIGGLEKNDFEVLESGREREIISVEPVDAPFNLVLLLDVSGSVDNYVDFIRKSARNFVNTVDPRDKVAIVIFNEDVEVLSNFSSDKQKLSESLDSFDAGGGTGYYDALAYALTETLKPLRGERTAIVVLSDGDDNRSFLPFDSLLGSIQESGALVYPLYVPSGLIAASATSDPAKAADPLRTRYLSLTSKAESEGEILAKISGGVYYPITQISQLQKAYEDIVVQLRTAYSVTFRSDIAETRGNGSTAASPRLKVRVKRENAFTKLGSVVEVSDTQSENKKTETIQNENVKADKKVEDKNIEITGEITGIEYKPLLTSQLKEIPKQNFDINTAPSAFILSDSKKKIAVSRWVSPKRTRSYPYERVYNTLSQPKRITIIPVVKDEGAKGDRDFIQFDTFSLMSLLEVFVIPAFYSDADTAAREGKITNQKFDNNFILSKIDEIENYHSSALHWNLKQLGEMPELLEKASDSYKTISQKTGVAMHGEQGIKNFSERIKNDLDDFMNYSRFKAQNAQNREFLTLQPKESLSSNTKGRVTITNYLGGKYFFTCDETRIENGTILLIEAKHSSRAKLPSQSDIKDGLLKLIIYSNLRNVRVNEKETNYKSVLRLTSNNLKGEISSDSSVEEFETFSKNNLLTKKQKEFIGAVFEEAKQNRFIVKLESAAVAVIEDFQHDLRI